MAASYRLLWDLQGLYAFVAVTDSDLSADSPALPWEDDSIEIYLDADASHGTSYDGRNDFQYVFRVDDPALHVGSRSAGTTAGIRFATARTAAGYALEVAIPWTTLGVSPSSGARIGFDVHVNDDDGGGNREGKLAAFARVDMSWTDPSLFALVALEGTGGRHCSVDTERELLIRDLSVVEDPVRTGPGGVFTLGRLLEDMAPSPAAAPAMAEQFVRSFGQAQVINGLTVGARPVAPIMLDAWPRDPNGQLSLQRAPFRLLAIVNRIDLRDLSRGQAGEGRFVFGLVPARTGALSASCGPTTSSGLAGSCASSR